LQWPNGGDHHLHYGYCLTPGKYDSANAAVKMYQGLRLEDARLKPMAIISDVTGPGLDE
jgi:hypothetical protein